MNRNSVPVANQRHSAITVGYGQGARIAISLYKLMGDGDAKFLLKCFAGGTGHYESASVSDIRRKFCNGLRIQELLLGHNTERVGIHPLAECGLREKTGVNRIFQQSVERPLCRAGCG